jgi:hypothetical protein
VNIISKIVLLVKSLKLSTMNKIKIIFFVIMSIILIEICSISIGLSQTEEEKRNAIRYFLNEQKYNFNETDSFGFQPPCNIPLDVSCMIENDTVQRLKKDVSSTVMIAFTYKLSSTSTAIRMKAPLLGRMARLTTIRPRSTPPPSAQPFVLNCDFRMI